VTTLTDITAVHIYKAQDGLWHIVVQASSRTVYEEFANDLDTALAAARLALERFRDETKPGTEYYDDI